MAHIGLDLRFWRSGTGGIGRYSRNLLTELLAVDTENRYTAIITPADQPEFLLTSPNLVKEVVDIPHYSLAEQTKLNGYLAKQNFDLMHFTNFNHPIMYRGKFVVTVHDLIMHLPNVGGAGQPFLKRAAYRTTMRDCRRAERVIVPSESTKSDLVKLMGFKEDRIVVTPEGSEGSFRPHSDAEKTDVRARLGLPNRYLLFVSRWVRYKGLQALLDAFERLRREDSELGLVIAGSANKAEPAILARIEKLKSSGAPVITPGFVSDCDLAAMYSAATVYVHPSWYEGFGIMILEAFASGVPVVTSNVSSLPEVVGDAGILVDPRESEAIAAALQELINDTARRNVLIAKGLERVKQFSWRTMAEQTLRVYREVLAEK